MMLKNACLFGLKATTTNSKTPESFNQNETNQQLRCLSLAHISKTNNVALNEQRQNLQLILPKITIDNYEEDGKRKTLKSPSDSELDHVTFCDEPWLLQLKSAPSKNEKTAVGQNTVKLGRGRATSKSFNEKSLLTIPKVTYKHQRSKSEKTSRRGRSRDVPPSNVSTSCTETQLSVSSLELFSFQLIIYFPFLEKRLNKNQLENKSL